MHASWRRVEAVAAEAALQAILLSKLEPLSKEQMEAPSDGWLESPATRIREHRKLSVSWRSLAEAVDYH